ncbi:outer membrane protein [Mesorhizobium sp. L-8-10]|uniref:outer membrane protein n=1 Tax=unclassified Mesorhizobium TaxID=325217 RepID=UPI0019368423|nr:MULTISPECIES: outer membrane protein [unclassified Mesorhizobium]BCH22636.1 outer membrane protein [Mesorhizobium sp. L-8-3]BCH30440.1 outer membrane protein [Mesorhizobium sp. L-8-10]
MRSSYFLFASALAVLAATGAKAADAVIEPPPVVIETPTFTWTGPYIGLQGGYAWSNARFSDPFVSVKDNFDGGLLGGYVGYQWQYGSFVFGGEADINALWNDQTFDVGGLAVDVGADWLASIRARAGYAIDRALIFGTGGVAFTGVSADTTIGGLDISASETYTGWTLGGGVDYAFTDNWIGRLEYRYYDFGDSDVFDNGNLDIQYNTVTVGVAYKW